MIVHDVAVNRIDDVEGQIPFNRSYIWIIAMVAALGGLLFGYDWVVIGGARPFYEAYFHLNSDAAIGWSNSCALVGCFLGSMLGGRISDLTGRKRTIRIAALIFAVSSLLTGWSYSFTMFIVWRIFGGVAIGLASNVSPMYIAEVSPAIWRGRLVSLNQMALVVGILLAQVANWCIARPVPPGLSAALAAASWNAQFGWRWMFTAVAIPALVLLLSVPLIPESPRWLATRHQRAEARSVLARIGGDAYADREIQSINKSLESAINTQGIWKELLSPGVRKLLVIGIGLAVLQQASGINILFNYAEEVYRGAGFGVSDILFNIVITGSINLLFTVAAMLMVDRFGRRRLMLFGCLGVGASHIAASLAYRYGAPGSLVLSLTLCAIACYAMSLAPVTWVLITEIFPNRVRAVAVSIAVGALWIASFVLTYTFPILHRIFGMANTFLLYGAICLLGAILVYLLVPETKARSLEQLEQIAN
jgi:MFS transporter, SP family, xylose:H+ symportor